MIYIMAGGVPAFVVREILNEMFFKKSIDIKIKKQYSKNRNTKRF